MRVGRRSQMFSLKAHSQSATATDKTALLSHLFGTIIIAVAINLVTNLGQS